MMSPSSREIAVNHDKEGCSNARFVFGAFSAAQGGELSPFS
jgi:hypothetical protein